ncbi:MAG: VTT domain-containing protein [Acidobacteriaceae bacterium]|nr:VTT domain-containing protein [Acidobacteriaceae bacterium]
MPQPSAHSLTAWQVFVAKLLSWGPLGLFSLAILDSAGLPVVGGVDVLLVAIAANHPEQAYGAALCAIGGSLLGSSVLFGIARKGGEVLLSKYIASRRGARLHAWFERYGLVTVFIPALSPLPLPMKIPVFCAGALEVRWPFFLGVVLAARTLRYFALAFLGLRYGQMTFGLLRTHLGVVVLLALALAAVALLVLRIIEGPERPVEESVE